MLIPDFTSLQLWKQSKAIYEQVLQWLYNNK
jgi:hypothetical protein